MMSFRSSERCRGTSTVGCQIDSLVNDTDMVWEYFLEFCTSIQLSSLIWPYPDDRVCRLVKYITTDK